MNLVVFFMNNAVYCMKYRVYTECAVDSHLYTVLVGWTFSVFTTKDNWLS